jgi:hypothetical protein
MIPAARTPNNNICPKSWPAELETTLPCAATGDGRPDGGARVPPSSDDASAALSSPALRECVATPPIARPPVVTASALGPGGTDSSATVFALGAGSLREDDGAGPDNTVATRATGARTGGGSNSTTSVTAGWSALGNASATGRNVCVNGVRSTVGGGMSGTLRFRSIAGSAVELGRAGGVGSCAVAGSVDEDSGAGLASSVCADAGDALSRSHAATASRPRRRKPPISATFVLMIGTERCITPRSTGQ